MSCCGETIKKLAGISVGYSAVWLDRLFHLPRPKYQYADVRLAICRMCEKSTWLTRQSYVNWIDVHSGKGKFVRDISNLESWPELPVGDQEPGAKLFCRICKCWLPAKAYIKDEKCPLNKWDSVV
jgi:hypothetical protein